MIEESVTRRWGAPVPAPLTAEPEGPAEPRPDSQQLPARPYRVCAEAPAGAGSQGPWAVTCLQPGPAWPRPSTFSPDVHTRRPRPRGCPRTAQLTLGGAPRTDLAPALAV